LIPLLAQEELRKDPPTWEGALSNDVFLPVSEPAGRSLLEGDRALERARAAAGSGSTGEERRQIESACESWRQALLAAAAGGSTWFELGTAADEALRRLSEGVHAAVLRRLSALTPAELERWRARFEPLAAEGLARALAQSPREGRRETALAEVERAQPLTQSAARAALALSDLARERGQDERARAWLARAARHAGSGPEQGLAEALARRAGQVPSPAPPEEEPWTSASSFSLVDTQLLEGESARAPLPERGLRPGLAFLDDGRAVLQAAREVFLLRIGQGGELELSRRFDPARLLEGFAPDPELDAPRDPPGWPLLPCAHGSDLVLVLGRGSEHGSNALVVLEPPRELGGAERGPLLYDERTAPRLRWAWAGSDQLDSRLEAHRQPELAQLGEFEFQPGPVVCGERVLAQAREFASSVRSWLLAFELDTGELAWMRLIASGADLVPSGRFSQGQRLSSQPLLAFEHSGELRVLAGTHLGAGALFDALDGEPLWTLKYRRRDALAAGWNGGRPMLARCPLPGPVPEGSPGGPILLLAPADSDRLYTLDGRALGAAPGETGALLLQEPQSLGEAEVLVGGAPDEVLVFGNAGEERTLTARRPGRDRLDALDLGPDERFRGQGLLSPTRVWACTNRGLYLFDRTRELYLLDHESLPAGQQGGGEIHARGRIVLAVGQRAVWSFRVE
jgi:hypothetical protein